MVRCLLCGRESKNITRPHLKKHGITLKEYQLIMRKMPTLLTRLNTYRHDPMVIQSVERLASAITRKKVVVKV